MSEVDLHIHSTFSGGVLSPEDIVSKSVELGLTVIAVTDHDSTDGVGLAQTAAKENYQKERGGAVGKEKTNSIC